MHDILSGGMRRAERAMPVAATAAATVLLAAVLAYWTWAVIAPRAETPTAFSTGAAVTAANAAAAATLFGTAQANETTAPAGIAIRLLGVVAASDDRRGHAVVQLDKDILAVLEGEAIASGLRLAEVHPDHVILERDGVREKVAWPQKSATPPSPVARKARK